MTESQLPDEDCSPNKVCRNMTHVNFDGFSQDGSDPMTAWREKLIREGKWRPANPADDAQEDREKK